MVNVKMDKYSLEYLPIPGCEGVTSELSILQLCLSSLEVFCIS